MTLSVSTDIASILHGASLGALGTDLFISKEPAEGTTLITTIYEYSGSDPNPKFRLDYPAIQIRVRGAINGYLAAEARIQAIKNVLLGAARQTVNSNVYVGIQQTGGVMFLKYDELERPIFVTNWRIMVQPAASDNRIQLG